MLRTTRQVNSIKLIQLVKKYPLLYDDKNVEYADLNKKDAIWQSIALELNISVSLCKAKWNSLRSSYRRVLRAKINGRFSNERKWRFEEDLSFLREVVLEKQQKRRNFKFSQNAVATSDEENESGTASVIKQEELEIIDEFSDKEEQFLIMNDLGPLENTRLKCDQSVMVDTEEEKETKVLDNITPFFMALAQTVKKLPPITQVKVKAEVFSVVNLAEFNYLQSISHSNENLP